MIVLVLHVLHVATVVVLLLEVRDPPVFRRELSLVPETLEEEGRGGVRPFGVQKSSLKLGLPGRSFVLLPEGRPW